MRLVLGVDSAKSSETLWDIAVKELGTYPAFWGRYLTDGHVGATPLTTKEAEFLHRRRCRIVPIYNGITEDTCQTMDHAERHASEAIRLAEALGVPRDVTVFGDIEHGWEVTGVFMERWKEEMSKCGYVPGLYLPFGVYAPRNVKVWRALWVADIYKIMMTILDLKVWDMWQYKNKGQVDFNITIENDLCLW